MYLPGRYTAVIEPGSTTLSVNLEIETKSDEQTDSKKSAEGPHIHKCTCRSCCCTCNREIALLLDTPDQRCNLRPRLDVNLVFLCVDCHSTRHPYHHRTEDRTSGNPTWSDVIIGPKSQTTESAQSERCLAPFVKHTRKTIEERRALQLSLPSPGGLLASLFQ